MRDRTGSNNSKWRGGRTMLHGRGSTRYVRVRAEGHPRADTLGQYVLEHILVAEEAIGHHLPPEAVIHHRDGDGIHNAPGNLIVCQDNAYHRDIHLRERVYRAGGRPGIDHICGKCGLVKPRTEFYASRTKRVGIMSECKACVSVRGQGRVRAR